MAKPATLWTQNYESGVQNAQAKYDQGVQNPRRDWQSELQGAKPRMIQNFTQSMNDGRFDAGVSNVGTAGWKQKTLAKSSNYSAAASRAAEAYRARVPEMHAVAETVQARVNAMPRNTHQERMQRMVMNATGIKEEWSRRR